MFIEELARNIMRVSPMPVSRTKQCLELGMICHVVRISPKQKWVHHGLDTQHSLTPFCAIHEFPKNATGRQASDLQC